MVSTQQNLVRGKSSLRRGRSNRLGKLLRRLPGISTLLIDLSGCRFDKTNVVIFHRSLDGSFENPRMGRAN
jgi:hypothetical protein